MTSSEIKACRRCNGVVLINGSAWSDVESKDGPISIVHFIFSGHFCARDYKGTPEDLISISVETYVRTTLEKRTFDPSNPAFVELNLRRRDLPCVGYPVEPFESCGEFELRDNGLKRLSIRFSRFGPVAIYS